MIRVHWNRIRTHIGNHVSHLCGSYGRHPRGVSNPKDPISMVWRWSMKYLPLLSLVLETQIVVSILVKWDGLNIHFS